MGKEYLKTHPWLTFTLDQRRLTFNFWFLLGEAQSKCRHIKDVPLAPDFAKELRHVSLVKGVHATTAIEGNTLTEEEVENQINKKGASELPVSKQYLGTEVDNIFEALNDICTTDATRADGPEPLTLELIKKLNGLVLRNLDGHDSAGEIRTRSVVVGNAYRGAPAIDCKYLIVRLCDWMNSSEGWSALGEDKKMAVGIMKAMIAHLYFAWIHPFEDGNGRTARLIEFKLLFDSGLSTNAAHLLSNFYNDTRSKYYSVLADTSREGGHPEVFMEYAIEGLVDSLDSHIDSILDEQLNVAWGNYVHKEFKNTETKTQKRQRNLLLEITEMNKNNPDILITRRYIEKNLSKDLEFDYKDSEKMLPRDINMLKKRSLLIVYGNRKSLEQGVKPNLGILHSYIDLSIG